MYSMLWIWINEDIPLGRTTYAMWIGNVLSNDAWVCGDTDRVGVLRVGENKYDGEKLLFLLLFLFVVFLN